MNNNEEKLFYAIKDEYKSFRETLIEKIKDNKISFQNDECYLVPENSELKLLKNFNRIENEIEKNKNGKLEKINYNCSDEVEIHTSNNIHIIINDLKYNKKYRLFSRKLIELLYKKDILKGKKIFHYFAGNNLLIIELEDDFISNSLLILNPLDIINNNKNALIVSFQKKNKDTTSLYSKIFTQKLNIKPDLNIQLIENNQILKFDILNNDNISKFFDLFNITQKEENFNDIILKIMIYIYYYEKILISENHQNLFTEDEDYYLINYNWLQKYKNIFDYNKIYNLIENNNNKYFNITYNNIEEKIDKILELISNNYKNVTKLVENNEIINEDINPNQKFFSGIYYFDKSFILPKKIMEMIKQILPKNNDIIFEPKKLYEKGENIFFFENLIINVGCLNKELIFYLNYFFLFKFKNVFYFEKDFFINHSLNEYINLRNCKTNIINSYQSLKDETNFYRGELLILDEDKINESNNDNSGNQIYHNNISKDKSWIKRKIKNLNNYKYEDVKQKNFNNENEKLKKEENNIIDYKIKEKEYIKEQKKLEEKIENLERENKEKKEQIEKNREDIDKEKKNISEIQKENNELNEEILKIKLELAELKEKNKKKENELINSNNKIQEQKTNIETLKISESKNNEKINLLKKSLRDSEEKEKNLEKELEEKNKIIAEINNNYKKKQKELENKTNELKKESQKNENISNELVNSKRKLEEANKEIELIQKEKNQKENELEENKKNNDSSIFKMKEENDNLINELNEKIDKLTENEKDYLSRIKEFEDKIKENEDKIKEYEDKKNLDKKREEELNNNLIKINEKEREINLKIEKIKGTDEINNFFEKSLNSKYGEEVQKYYKLKNLFILFYKL